MKRLFLGVAIMSFLSSGAYAIDAELKDVILYKGDKGGYNVCQKGNILVRELYKVSNTPLDNLILIYSNPKYKANARFVKTKVNEYLVDNNYCVSKSDLSTPFKTNTRFMNNKNEKSKIISFIVKIPNSGLREAKEWNNLKSIKIKNKLMQ